MMNNVVTATFENFDFECFEIYKVDALSLGLEMISWRVEDFKLVTFKLRGHINDIRVFTNWINVQRDLEQEGSN
jgi:hypothetical protein